MSELLKQLHRQIILFDGAMGTMLQQKGLVTGELPEIFNMEKPDIVQEIHQEYVAAGSKIITTNTFQANEIKLKGSPYSPEEIIRQGVRLAKSSGAQYVALDIGPIGQLMEPMGTLTFDAAYNLFRQQMVAGADAGADLILIETISDLYEAKAAVLAAKENTKLPVFCTLTYQNDGRTFTGTDPLTAANVLNGLGVDAFGVNCSLGPESLGSIVDILLRYALVPVMVKPNAGLPEIKQGNTVFNVLPTQFAQYMKVFAKKGVGILGGCCGTTPDHIRALASLIKDIPFNRPVPARITAASSSSQTFVLNQNVGVIGERINPTGKKKLKEAIRNNAFDYIVSEALLQSKAGADILDVNMGLPEIDEPAMLTAAVKHIQAVTPLPLQIDSSNGNAISQAIRYYNGRPILNSVNGEQKSMDTIFPIAQKYGALLIALTLDENGIPATASHRFQIAERIVKEAQKYNIPKESIIVDCLVLTASAQQEQVIETLKAVSLIKSRLGLKTALGISNVSFGLPSREDLNAVFLASAMGAGLDLAIVNPLSKRIMDTIACFKVINHQDIDSKQYLERFSTNDTAEAEKQKEKMKPDDLQQIIIDGRKDECPSIVRDLLNSNTPVEIINLFFIPALNFVGEEYGAGKLFLPQLIQSAETVKAGFEVLKEYPESAAQKRTDGMVVLATVQGDIHDIGKNIVKMMLENYGYQILDLGKDVKIEKLVRAVAENPVRLVGLSALMTTTVQNMKDSIFALRQGGYNGPVMVGGAVLNKEYADFVGADFYAQDARDGIKIAQSVFQS